METAYLYTLSCEKKKKSSNSNSEISKAIENVKIGLLIVAQNDLFSNLKEMYFLYTSDVKLIFENLIFLTFKKISPSHAFPFVQGQQVFTWQKSNMLEEKKCIGLSIFSLMPVGHQRLKE